MVFTALVAALVSAAIAVPVALYVDRSEEPAANVEAVAEGGVEGGDGPLIAEIAAEVSPSVVSIDVRSQAGVGGGSGVVYREDGYILTNNHVVAQAAEVGVTLPDGSTQAAELVGTDPSSDLAVLRVESEGLPVPTFGDGSDVVGETTVAIGSPFGLEGSVTSGILSAVGRTVPAADIALFDMLQTDAPINPGNSGGALVNSSGEVIGINTAILSPSGGNLGIGFAIPITTAIDVADQLIETGTVRHGFLGVQGQDVDPTVADLYGLSIDRGALIAAVGEGTPADDAGLQRGDIVVGVDEEPIESMTELAGRLQQRQPGDQIVMTVLRAGEELEVQVELGERPQQPQLQPPPVPGAP